MLTHQVFRSCTFPSLLALAFYLSTGCTPYFHQPLRVGKARLGAETPGYSQLANLPVPKEKVVAAVYKFRDQTGQYKPSEVGTSWSTAVTQGATSILLRAMEESGWFIPIEREGLSNLLNERQIIRSSRANFAKDKDTKAKQPLLPPLLFAGVILEGGIISFDSNMLTGGAGARYFGAGASTQYREDRVTIYLRAVSSSNGRILKTVYTSKTILSQKVDVGIFRFVKVKRLLEAETGFTFNEPGEMAVKEAIEKAVTGLILEGVLDGLWQLDNPGDRDSPAFLTYLKEKEDNQERDVFGVRHQQERGKLALSLHGGGFFYDGDYSGGQPFGATGLQVAFPAQHPFSPYIGLSYGRLGTEKAYEADLALAELGLSYRFFNRSQFSPYLTASGGAIIELDNNLNRDLEENRQTFPFIAGTLGAEQLIHRRMGILVQASYRQLFSDKLDGLEQGKYDDAFWDARVGITFYLN